MEEIARDWVGEIADRWAELRPDLDPSPLLVLGRIQRIAALTEPTLRAPLAEAGLADGDFDLLAALRRQGPPHQATPGELTSAMLVTSGATSKRLDRLERQGYVERRVSTGDGRSRVVSLTKPGRELIDTLITQHLNSEAKLLDGLTNSQRHELAQLLHRLARTLEQTTTHTPTDPPTS